MLTYNSRAFLAFLLQKLTEIENKFAFYCFEFCKVVLWVVSLCVQMKGSLRGYEGYKVDMKCTGLAQSSSHRWLCDCSTDRKCTLSSVTERRGNTSTKKNTHFGRKRNYLRDALLYLINFNVKKKFRDVLTEPEGYVSRCLFIC